MKIFVTGIDGYIGTVLGQKLLEQNYDVIGLDAGYYRSGYLYNNGENTPFTITKDIREIKTSDLVGFDAIVHMAELSNDPLGENNPKVTYEINHMGSLALAKKAKEAGVKRFIYTSSCSVYGIADGDKIMDENAKVNPQTAYAECKVLVEKSLTEIADENFSPVFLRNATVYGPSPRMRFDIVLNNLCGLAYTDREIKMVSDGTPWRPIVHIDDVCTAIKCCLEAPIDKIHSQIFNVGSNEQNYQVKDIAAIVKEVFTDCEVIFGNQGADNRSYRVNFDKISSQLPGFSCSKNPLEGATELLNIFNKIHLTKEVFEYKAYTRLKELKYLIETHQIDEKFNWNY